MTIILHHARCCFAAKLNTSLVLLATTLALAHAYYMPTRGHLMNNAAWWISALLVALLLPYTYVAMSRSTGVLLKAAKEAPPTATAPPAGPDVPGMYDSGLLISAQQWAAAVQKTAVVLAAGPI